MSREESFGQTRPTGLVDRVGRALSVRKGASFLNTQKLGVVADVGCGYYADLSKEIFNSADEVHLFDLSIAENVAVGRKTVRHVGSLPAVLTRIPDYFFESIFMNNVLEHLFEPSKTLVELYRVLAPGGRLYLNVPSWRGKGALELAAFRLGLAPFEEMNDHKMYYDKKDLWPVLIAAGFKPSDVRIGTHKFGLNTYAKCVKTVMQ